MSDSIAKITNVISRSEEMMKEDGQKSHDTTIEEEEEGEK